MLAYQHAYHAGNFADVHKHLALYLLTQALKQKSSAVSFVDTHSGRGFYPLAAQETQKLGEYRNGIERVWQKRQALKEDPLLASWLSELSALQTDKSLSYYPGSPWWLSHAMSEQDRLTLFELHPAEHQHLTDQALPNLHQIKRVFADGLKGLVNMLPVKTPRVCVLIDPSYERKEEYQEVADCLAQVTRKARHAVVMIWYPLLPAGRHLTLIEALQNANIPKLWQSELIVREPGSERGMYGSGLIVMNPPWQLDQTLNDSFKQIAPFLSDSAQIKGHWLTSER